MYRQIFIPNEQSYLVPIPPDWYGREVEVIAFLTKNAVKPRHNWAEAARQMHIAGDDILLMPSASNNENTDWWTWNE